MSTYFVRTDGNNANAGTGYGTASAWQTIAKAVSMVADGDTVRIAPGTYRETVVIATSGPGSYINWKGDKEAQYFLDMKPGYVRITGCDTNEIVGSTTVIHINSKTHNRFYDLVVDGVAGLSAVNGSGGAVYFYRCIISGFGGLYGVSSGNTYAYNCVFTGTTGCLATTCYNCICMSGNTGFQSCICYNCMSVGTYTAFYLSTCYNCTAYSPGSAAFFACNSYNCLVYGGQIGFYNDGSYITYKGKALNCSYPAYGSSLTNLFNTSDIEVCQVSTATRLTYNIGLTQPTGTISGGHYEGYTDISKLFKIATALKFDISQKGRSTDTHSYRVSGMSNNVITPNVTGVTSNTNANDYYLEEGTYNGASFYVSRVRLHVIFLSTTLQAGRYVMTAGVTPNESAVGYCHSATLAGTYTNVSWTGVTIAVSQATNANQDYEIGGTYNGQNWYRSIFRNYVLFYSSTLQLNNWVLTAGIQVNEAATNYAYLNTITGTYTKVGTYTGTIINITFRRNSLNRIFDADYHKHASIRLINLPFKRR